MIQARVFPGCRINLALIKHLDDTAYNSLVVFVGLGIRLVWNWATCGVCCN